jgi:hypothetical protein
MFDLRHRDRQVNPQPYHLVLTYLLLEIMGSFRFFAFAVGIPSVAG